MPKDLENARYIESDRTHVREYSRQDPATRFRKVFSAPRVRRAVLHHAGLGIGYFTLNGTPVENAVLSPSQSDYLKTVWYRTVDVTEWMVEGTNVLAATVGNGFYNESVAEPFSPNLQSWRGNPKLIARLEMEMEDGREVVVSDGSWVCSDEGPVRFNQVRNGETYDARMEDPGWNRVGYDDGRWKPVHVSERVLGTPRPMDCEPVREIEVIQATHVTRCDDRWIFHFPRMVSGYARVSVRQPAGTFLTLVYGETLSEGLVDHRPLLAWSYRDSVFATDQLVCGEGETRWSPKFAYHGFQFIEVRGFQGVPGGAAVQAVFVSQGFRGTSRFECSHSLVQWVYEAGLASSRCNFHNVPTDCPTREKAGWTNDAQASARQFLLNFDSKRFLLKWYQDILDTQRADGAIACIAPCTEHYGFGWTAGPVSDGVLLEIPYQIHVLEGDPGPMKQALPAIVKYLGYLKSRLGDDGFLDFGLWDWAGPFDTYKKVEACPTPRAFTDTLLYMKFLSMAQVLGPDPSMEAEHLRLKARFDGRFLEPGGRSRVHTQTAVSMLLCLGYDPIPLASQLEELIAERGGRLHVGMLGLQYLFPALSLCGKDDLAFQVLTAQGFPSFSLWKDQGATTLWETWQCTASRNHHMFSCVLAWILETLVGYRVRQGEVTLRPSFPRGMDFVKGEVRGYGVHWIRSGDSVQLHITVPEKGRARLELKGLKGIGESLLPGHHRFTLPMPAGSHILPKP